MSQKPLKFLVISESGLTDRAAEALENLIAREPRLIAIMGVDCESLEDVCDQICVGYGSKPEVIVTTSHADESLEQVIEFVKFFGKDELTEAYEVMRV